MEEKAKKITFNDILRAAFKKQASDIHLKAGKAPVIRVHGRLSPLSSKLPPLSNDALLRIALNLMSEEQQKAFHENKEIDLSYGISGLGRFRIHIFKQRSSVQLVIRNIPDQVRPLSELNLPSVIEQIANIERGLIIVTGATGSGKTTTLTAIVDYINNHKSRHILMIEDPTEFLIRDKKSIITQRELETDTTTYPKALRAALRQDPDVILIGEMRDPETMATALTAAETGHLVLTSMHTLDAQETILRFISSFPHEKDAQIRAQLASVLKAIICQRLVRRKKKEGFIPAAEILINNARISELITNPQRTHEILSTIEDSQSWKMQSFDQSLMDLISRGEISYEEALSVASNPENFAIRYQGISQMDGKKWGDSSQFKKRYEEEWNRIADIEIDNQSLTQPEIKVQKKKKIR
ncbi:MAG: PilT/PilU family type 4a pilus ATPase [Bdellovibrio sp.]|nr:MAG: PilT/PilU family type 4a pilus ATPase [Bdellovibrio sp.]